MAGFRVTEGSRDDRIRQDVAPPRKLTLVLSNSRIQQLGCAIFLMAIYALAWNLQDQLFINYDVSWLLLATKRLLAGGTYAHDFFETNPPLILYLYLPPVILNKLLTVNMVLIFRGYIFFIASLMLVLCWGLGRKIFSEQDTWLAYLFFLAMALVFLVLPCFEFGQRDHLLVVLALPYLLLVVCRLQGEKFNSGYAAGLGLLAGLGFAIKPHFLMLPLLVEGYYAFYKKDKLAWLRPETLIIMLTIMIYVSSIFIFHPDYIYIVVPYSLRLYYRAVSQSWFALLLNGTVAYCGLSVLSYFIENKESRYQTLNTVLLLALLGSLFSYFAQRTTFYYHLVPALSLAFLLLLMLFYSLLSGLSRRWPEIIFASFLGALFFIFPAWIFCNLYWNSLTYKKQTLDQVTVFMNTYARQAPVYFFVATASYAFPAVDYTTTTIAPRFYFLWMVSGLVNQALDLAQHPGRPISEQYNKDKNFLLNMIADDLYQYKPRFVFVDQSADKYRIRDKNFNYLTYFSDNEKFRHEWSNYHYFATLEQNGLYKLGVYERKKV